MLHLSLLHLAATLLALGVTQAGAQGTTTSATRSAPPLYDPRQLPGFHGRLQLFTLTPRGDIDGFVMVDGTEVKTPPHLTEEIAAALKPGDAVTVHGLKAASLPMIQAMSVTNDASGRTVIDAGPEAPGHAVPPHADDTAAGDVFTSLQGRVRMVLHGPRGDTNGVLLDDGRILKLSPAEAQKLSALLVPGQAIAAEGTSRTTSAGTVVDLTAVGPPGGPMSRIGGERRSGERNRREPPV